MNKMMNIAIAGVGVVGKEVLDYMTNNSNYLAKNCGDIMPVVTNISTRSKRDIANVTWVQNPQEMLQNNIDILVELIGGADGVAYDLVKQALSNGISVVTANKALIAKHGNELLALAQKNNAALKFEAAVAGAIPVINVLQNHLEVNHITEISAILNGTSNFILSVMESENLSFATALKLAQEKGYAEADPSLDINGTDAAHKIAILSSLAFKTNINFDDINIYGIEAIDKKSFEIAKSLNYKIKLIAKTFILDNQIYQYVAPFFLKDTNALANINNSFNSVNIKSNLSGDTVLTGYGAGGKPTASAVVADICNIVKQSKNPVTQTNDNYTYNKNLDFAQTYLLHMANDNNITNNFKDILNKYHANISNEKIIGDDLVIKITSDNQQLIETLRLDQNIQIFNLDESN